MYYNSLLIHCNYESAHSRLHRPTPIGPQWHYRIQMPLSSARGSRLYRPCYRFPTTGQLILKFKLLFSEWFDMHIYEFDMDNDIL